MKRFAFVLTLASLLCASAWAQQPTSYSFKNIKYPNDTFIQLLGINNSSEIAGYHNFNTNSGFTLELPNHFTTENFPKSAMTQVIGINNSGQTDGFYVDTAGVTHGFIDSNGDFATVDFTANGAMFNQLLGINDNGQAVGYYSQSMNNSTPDFPYIYDEIGQIFEVITIPQATGGAQATGINNLGHVSGFYIDSAGVNHGFFLHEGTFKTLDVPGAAFTQALGVNNKDQVVGFFTGQLGNSHGFVWQKGKFQAIDDPAGAKRTVVNGINDKGQLVGYYGAPSNAPCTGGTCTGFVATPK
jgi:probable HAF family extracellular repeat protein